MIVRNPPADAPIRRMLSVDKEAPWSRADHLVALVFDALQQANWQRGGGKGPKPKPLPRPGASEKSVRKFGSDPIPWSQFDAWWNEGRKAEDG